MGGWMDGRTNEQMNEWTDRQTRGRLLIDGWMNEKLQVYLGIPRNQNYEAKVVKLM